MAWQADATSDAALTPDEVNRRLRAGWAIGVVAGVVTVFASLLADRLRARRAVRSAESAESPLVISGHGWWAIVRRTVREFNDDRIPTVAAGATYFALLSIFPALGAFAALYGLFSSVAQARDQVATLAGVLPGGAISVLQDQMTRLAALDHGRLGLTFVVSILVSVASSNAGVKAVIAGLNVAYETPERRGLVRLNLVSLGFTIGAILFMVAAVGGIAAVPDTLRLIGARSALGWAVARWPILLVLITALLSLLYRYGPCRVRARWRWVTPGSAFAAVGWMAMSILFSWYVANFGHYDRTYGSLGAVVGFMTWIWLSMIVVLFGAELNAEIEAQTVADTAQRR